MGAVDLTMATVESFSIAVIGAYNTYFPRLSWQLFSDPSTFLLAVQLNYHTDYALRVLTYLTVRPGRRVSTREMAEFYGISLHHLTKVAKFLTQRGWLVTM